MAHDERHVTELMETTRDAEQKVADETPADIVVYTRRIGSGDGEGMVYCRVTLNGEELPRVMAAAVEVSVDFSTAVVRLAPSSVRFETLTIEEWDKLPAKITADTADS